MKRATLATLGTTLAIAGVLLPGVALAAPHVANPGFDVEAATRAYLNLLQGPARAKSDAYFEGGYWLTLWGALVSIAVDLLLLASGLSSRWSAWALRVVKRRWLAPTLYALPYIVVSWLITLPWSIYTGFFREKQYGLMSQSFGGWLLDAGKELAISVVMIALLLTAIFAVIRNFPRTWWLWGAAIVSAGVFVLVAVSPVFLAPLFNTYTEMTPGPLRDRIVAMAQANHIPAQHIYVFDASRQSKRISANVSGLGPTIRISLNDNLLERTGPDEVAAVMGHEMGHYVLGHVPRMILLFTLLFVIVFALIYRAAPALIAGNPRWGVRGIADPAATPVLGILAAVAGLLLTPITNSIIRYDESEADVFGLNAAREPDGFAKTAMRLSEYRKISPAPIEEALFFDHPSGERRVRMSMQWKKDHVPGATVVTPDITLDK